MPPPPAEIFVKQRVAIVPSPHSGEKVRMRGCYFHSRQRTNSNKTVPSETRPADAFLPRLDSPHDRSQAARLIALAFHKADSDCARRFQITQIAATPAGSVSRSTRPPRSDVLI